MKPLADWPLAERRNLRGVFTDIDDTLTTHGAITPDALHSLAALAAAGLTVIAITGRPIGWCEPFMRGDASRGVLPWPVAAMVAENGALAYAREPSSKNSPQRAWDVHRPLSKLYQQDAATRAANAARRQQVAAHILREVPGAQITRDSGGRETDLAFDHGEHCQLPVAETDRIVALLQAAGMHTTVSSIHIHGCFGDFNKWQGAQWIVRSLLGRELAQELAHWAFVGDSGNDQAMFQHFTHSVGVANIAQHAARLQHLPRYVTPGERGAGFAELARAILAARAP